MNRNKLFIIWLIYEYIKNNNKQLTKYFISNENILIILYQLLYMILKYFFIYIIFFNS
jgi:hypothetical protein